MRLLLSQFVISNYVLFISNVLCIIGGCYCQDAGFVSERNDLICMDGEDNQNLDPCEDDEICVGPTTPDDAQLFSSSIFCTKGKSILTYFDNL